MDILLCCLPLLIGWTLDFVFGDPIRLPHPIVLFGKVISACEHKLNTGFHRKAKGALCAIGLILTVYLSAAFILDKIENTYVNVLLQGVAIFYCLSGTTLIREVKGVFAALETGLEAGRKQVGRIVGRDTSDLTTHEVQTAALETLAENLSDGVVAPLFWYALLGVPGMLAYKMVNTLDSMVGYKNDRYKDFGWASAKIDDIANYLPARITSLLMLSTCGKLDAIGFVRTYGSKHLSPNSGYPEAALAGILHCRFGGPHYYFGQLVYKPHIGDADRALTCDDMRIAVSVNRRVECLFVVLVLIFKCALYLYF